MRLRHIIFGVMVAGAVAVMFVRMPRRNRERSSLPKNPGARTTEGRVRTEEGAHQPDEQHVASRLVVGGSKIERPKGTATVSEFSSLRTGEVLLTDHLTNAGHASAIAAVETFVWAAINDRDEIGEKLIIWTWRDKAQEFLDHMPEFRLRSATPESVLFATHKREASSAGGLEIVRSEVLGPKDEVFRIRFLNADGSSREEQFLMRLTDAGWKKEELPTRLGSMVYRHNGEKAPWAK